MKNKLVIASTLASICLVAAFDASAGYQQQNPVTIGGNYANGALGTARNSADSMQYMSCHVYSNYSPPLAYCVARNAAGVFASCTTNTERYVDLAQSLNTDSYLQFQWSGGTCTHLNVINASYLEPKQ